MLDDSLQQTRIRGKRALTRAVQELAWADDLVIGRIDWTPDPENAAGSTQPVEEYLLTVLTDADEVQERIPRELLEQLGNPQAGGTDPVHIKERLRPLIAGLRH